MKRIVTYISSALLLMAGLCISCQKEQSSSEEKGASVNEVIVKATIGGADTKVSFTEDGSRIKTAWEGDDNIVGWDDEGNAIELKIASIDNGIAIFKTVEDSSPIPTSGKVYMIYAPGTVISNISSSSLEYGLSEQGSGKVPALMTATGEVEDGVLELTFTNRLAILAVKNPIFPVTEATAITGLKLSGSNILTMTKFSIGDEGELKMESSEEGEITRACEFTTDEEGKTTETMVYFAVLPNSTAAEVTVSTTDPEGYQISFSGKSFEAGKCYLLSEKDINKQTFAITAPGTITGGTITTDPSGSVAWGTEVTVTATPSEGYELDGSIAVNGTSGSIEVTGNKFTMPQEDVTVSGSFKKTDYAIAVNGTGTGTYTVEGGSYTVKNSSGTDVTTAQIGDVITVTPSHETGYSGGTVTVQKTGSEETVDFDTSSNTFTMPAANVTITVTFTHDTYAINGTVTPESSGTVTFKKSGSEDGITQACYGETINVIATPATGYELESIKWNKESGSDEDITSAKSFTMPAKAVTVTVTFKKKKVYSFKVDASNTKVVFAPGNLYAKIDGSTWKWGFYDEQYKFHPDSMEKIAISGGSREAASSDTEIDLFCWGYSSNSTNYNDQSINTSFKDWGTSNLGLPSAPGNTWRTLTCDEWTHLLQNRTGISTVNGTPNARYLMCKVNDGTRDVCGLMIFPDDFTWPTTVTAPTSGINAQLAWGSVPGYTTDQFAALEGAGVVFLPAAGYRDVTNVKYVGNYGDYWSSTVYNSSNARYLLFYSSSVTPDNYDPCRNGRSVRLVSVVQ